MEKDIFQRGRRMADKFVQKIQLISDNLCYCPCPAEDDEIIQRLTVRRDGRVFLAVYNYMRVLLYRQWLRCDPVEAGRLLDKITSCLSDNCPLEYWTDVGSWTLQTFYSDGSREEKGCSLHGGQIFDDLTNDIRRVVGVPSLFGFSGENERAITLMEACKKAISGEKYIACVLDIGRGYVIMPTSDTVEVPCSSPYIVYKDSGKVDVFFPPEHQDEIKAERYLRVPLQYALPKPKQ